MRLTAPPLLALATLAAVLAEAPAARGEDPAPPTAAATAKKNLENLKIRARVWLDLRKTVAYKCDKCGGDGKILFNIGTMLHPVFEKRNCTKCVRGALVRLDRARQAYFDYATPAWKALDANVTSTQAFVDSLPADPAKCLLREYKIESVLLVGPRHGLVTVTETHETPQVAPIEYRWVLIDDPKDSKTKAQQWYIWHEETDLAWGASPPDQPAEAPAATPPGTTPPPPPTPGGTEPPVAKIESKELTEGDLARITKLFVLSGVAHVADSGHVEGDILVLKLHVNSGPRAKDQLEEAIARDVVGVAKAGFVIDEKAASIRLVFQARYRDRLGNVEFHPFKSYSIARDLFGKIKFDNLTREEVLDLFEQQEETHRLDGLVMWWKD